jgi:hypothetical protein
MMYGYIMSVREDYCALLIDKYTVDKINIHYIKEFEVLYIRQL